MHLLFSVRDVTYTIDGLRDNEETASLETSIDMFLYETLEAEDQIISNRVKFLLFQDSLADVLEEEFPTIFDTDIKYAFFNNLDIAIQKRKLFGSICEGDEECVVVDEQGVPFDYSQLLIGKQIHTTEKEIKILKPITSPAVITMTKSIIAYLESLEIGVTDVFFSQEEMHSIVRTDKGIDIRFSAENTVFETTRALYIVFNEIFNGRQNLSEIDITDPNVIRYVPKNS